MKKLLFYIHFLNILIVAPLVANAQGGPITNPLNAKFGTLPLFLEALLKDVIIPIGTIVVVVMVIYSGFLFVAASGKPEKLVIAKKTIMWTLIGAMIVLGAQAISNGVQGTVTELR